MSTPKIADLKVRSYFVVEDCLRGDVVIERCRRIDGPDLWAVRIPGFCMSHEGDWLYEPIPSSRDDDFLARYRFASAEEALACFLEKGLV